MMAALLGLPGKINTLLGRLTSGRAGALDLLDTQITTRAPASSALSTSIWTNSLAAALSAVLSKGLLVPPKAAGLSAATMFLKYGTDLYATPSAAYCSLFESSFAPVSTSYADALNYSGAGYLALVLAHGAATNDAATGQVAVRITLDGVEVLPETIAAARSAVCPIGGIARMNAKDLAGADIVTLDAVPMLVPFYSSCRIEAKYVTATGGAVFWKLIKT